MKKLEHIIVGLFIISFIYVGYTYYNNYKKKEIYKTALVRVLEHTYKKIKTAECNSDIKMEDEIHGYFKVALVEYLNHK